MSRGLLELPRRDFLVRLREEQRAKTPSERNQAYFYVKTSCVTRSTQTFYPVQSLPVPVHTPVIFTVVNHRITTRYHKHACPLSYILHRQRNMHSDDRLSGAWSRSCTRDSYVGAAAPQAAEVIGPEVKLPLVSLFLSGLRTTFTVLARQPSQSHFVSKYFY